MPRSNRIDWLAPTLALCALWLAVTGMLVALNVALGLALHGFVMKAGPFVIAGFVTGRLVAVPARRPRIVAAAVLAAVSSAAWTSFTFATAEISADRALLLFAVGLPVHLLGGAWAYFGMFLGGRRRATPASADRPRIDPELQDLERELESELAREKSRGPTP